MLNLGSHKVKKERCVILDTDLPFSLTTNCTVNATEAYTNYDFNICSRHITMNKIFKFSAVTFWIHFAFVAEHSWYSCLLGRAIAGLSYGRFIAIRNKFKLPTYIQEPLVMGRRDCNICFQYM